MTGFAAPAPVPPPTELRAPPPPATKPPLYRLAVFLGLATASVIVCGLAVAALVRFDPAAALQPTVQVAPLALAFLFAHAVVVRRYHDDGGAYVGLDAPAFLTPAVPRAALIGALAIGVPSVLLLAAGELRIETGVAGQRTFWWSFASLLGLLVPAALWEELAFRGYLLSVLRERAGTRTALLVTSGLFGLVHWQNAGATVQSTAAVTLAGVFLGVIRLSTGSLYAAWAAHLSWNLTMAIVLRTPVSGFELGLPGYRVVDAGPDWLTGGTWGPEGGAAAMLGLAVGSWYFMRPMRREERTT